MANIRGRDFLTLQDYSPEEIQFILQSSFEFKRERAYGEFRKPLRNKTIAMIFQKPSTRTRVSFEVAMYELGGTALYLRWDDLQLRRGELISDTARVLSRYVHGIVARVYDHKDLEELAEFATVPVINALSDLFHPCQALADIMTIIEKKGRLKGVKVAFVGDGNNVCHSLMIACSKLGADIAVATPKGYEPKEFVIEWTMENASHSGSQVVITNDPIEAVENADVIYTDVFVSMGMEHETEKRKKDFEGWQVNKELVSHAKKDFIFMHCLPAHRGEEVAPEVIDDPVHSVVWDQAENRLHTEKALLALLI
ncbi:MAG: ornithine carbamoyltransferase [Candidatus Baldrarchaeia archaeon]